MPSCSRPGFESFAACHPLSLPPFHTVSITIIKALKKNKKTDPPELAGSDPSMAAIANLLEEHRKALSADFKTTISSLEAKLDLIQATVSDHGEKIASLESNLQDERMLTNKNPV